MSKLLELIPTTEHTVVLPVSGKIVKITPYKHGHTKSVLRAFNQVKNMKQGQVTKILGVMESLIDSCIVNQEGDTKLRCRDLQIADFTYLMLTLKSISKGEKNYVSFKCINEDCSERHDMSFVLEDCKVKNNDIIKETIEMKLGNNDIIMHMKPYTFSVMLANADLFGNDENMDENITKFYVSFIDAIEASVNGVSVLHDNLKLNEKITFLDQLEEKNILPILEYIEKQPTILWENEFTCQCCGVKNKAVIDKIINFFG